jgi:FtsZ-interacting cell division protein ZipA
MMDTNTLWIVIVVVLVIAAIILALVMTTRRRRTSGLKGQFGPEYKHAVDEYGSPHKAEAELQARQKRVGAFDLHPLAPEARDRFAEQWKQTQAEFVDAPDQAVADADRLVKQVMEQRGYPVGDFEQRAADISVDHPNVVTNYRTAHEIALKQEKGTATTEDLRQAMVHYKALSDDLLQTDTTEMAKKDNGKV